MPLGLPRGLRPPQNQSTEITKILLKTVGKDWYSYCNRMFKCPIEQSSFLKCKIMQKSCSTLKFNHLWPWLLKRHAHALPQHQYCPTTQHIYYSYNFINVIRWGLNNIIIWLYSVQHWRSDNNTFCSLCIILTYTVADWNFIPNNSSWPIVTKYW